MSTSTVDTKNSYIRLFVGFDGLAPYFDGIEGVKFERRLMSQERWRLLMTYSQFGTAERLPLHIQTIYLVYREGERRLASVPDGSRLIRQTDPDVWLLCRVDVPPVADPLRSWEGGEVHHMRVTPRRVLHIDRSARARTPFNFVKEEIADIGTLTMEPNNREDTPSERDDTPNERKDTTIIKTEGADANAVQAKSSDGTGEGLEEDTTIEHTTKQAVPPTSGRANASPPTGGADASTGGPNASTGGADGNADDSRTDHSATSPSTSPRLLHVAGKPDESGHEYALRYSRRREDFTELDKSIRGFAAALFALGRTVNVEGIIDLQQEMVSFILQEEGPRKLLKGIPSRAFDELVAALTMTDTELKRFRKTAQLPAGKEFSRAMIPILALGQRRPFAVIDEADGIHASGTYLPLAVTKPVGPAMGIIACMEWGTFSGCELEPTEPLPPVAIDAWGSAAELYVSKKPHGSLHRNFQFETLNTPSSKCKCLVGEGGVLEGYAYSDDEEEDNVGDAVDETKKRKRPQDDQAEAEDGAISKKTKATAGAASAGDVPAAKAAATSKTSGAQSKPASSSTSRKPTPAPAGEAGAAAGAAGGNGADDVDGGGGSAVKDRRKRSGSTASEMAKAAATQGGDEDKSMSQASEDEEDPKKAKKKARPTAANVPKTPTGKKDGQDAAGGGGGGATK